MFSPIALETFCRRPRSDFLPTDCRAEDIPFLRRSLEQLHSQRLRHSCRILGLPPPPPGLWRDVCRAADRWAGSAQSLAIYSLHYYGLKRPRNPQPPGSVLIAERPTWQLFVRPNPYPFFVLPALDPDQAGSGQDTGQNTESAMDPWLWLACAGLAPTLRQDPSGQVPNRWQAKSQLQLSLFRQLAKWKQQNPLYQNCTDLLCFWQPPDDNAVHAAPLLQEGMKSNVFLLSRMAGGGLLLRTPCARSGARLLCGVSRNWLCVNFGSRKTGLNTLGSSLEQAVRVVQEALCFEHLLQAEGLLLCNAAMGLRLVRELLLPLSSCRLLWLPLGASPDTDLLRRLETSIAPSATMRVDDKLVRIRFNPPAELLVSCRLICAAYWRVE